MLTRREQRRRLRSRRVRTVLAAGLVLGVGTAITLAAWTDTENATGQFGASVFGTESQSAGSPTYTSQTSSPGAALSFNATDLSPGLQRFAWLNVRTTPASTVGGTVRLTSTLASGGLASVLEYRAVRMPGPSPSSTCNVTAFDGTTGTPVWVAGSASTYVPASQVPPSPVPSAIGAAGAQLGFCFEVRISPGTPNSFQGQTGSVTWTFTATSAS